MHPTAFSSAFAGVVFALSIGSCPAWASQRVPSARPNTVRTVDLGDIGYDPEFTHYWDAWIGETKVIECRRIKATRVNNYKRLAIVAFIVDGPCGVPCYQERCIVFDRATCKKVGEFITKELIPAVAQNDPNAKDSYRERRIDWKRGVVINLPDKKTLPMTLDLPDGFFPDGQLPTPEQ